MEIEIECKELKQVKQQVCTYARFSSIMTAQEQSQYVMSNISLVPSLHGGSGDKTRAALVSCPACTVGLGTRLEQR